MSTRADETLARMRADTASDWPTRLLTDLEREPLVDRLPTKGAWARIPDVSEAERQAVACASVGLTAEMTADVTGVPAQTVKHNRAAVIYKLRAKNMTHAVAIALRQGLIT